MTTIAKGLINTAKKYIASSTSKLDDSEEVLQAEARPGSKTATSSKSAK